MTNFNTPQDVYEAVQERYGRIATDFSPETAASCCDETTSCCGDSDFAFGAGLYEVDLDNLPADVTGLSLGCGDPIALAGLSPGQTVLDLGSGGGIDCFLAAQRVGPTGRVIGVDMTPAMIEKANRNKAKIAAGNVEFRLGQIEALPVESDSVDVIVSNCVINLSPDKTAVFHEAFRVLKPGGKLAVSDMVTQGTFSPEERADLAAWSGCITGAEDVSVYVTAMRQAGFTGISLRDKAAPDIELAHTISLDTNPRLFSARITAVKPTATNQ
jgi:arsenite methyltransferase